MLVLKLSLFSYYSISFSDKDEGGKKKINLKEVMPVPVDWLGVENFAIYISSDYIVTQTITLNIIIFLYSREI